MIKRGVATRGLGTADIGPADTKHEEICFRSKEGWGGVSGKKTPSLGFKGNTICIHCIALKRIFIHAIIF